MRILNEIGEGRDSAAGSVTPVIGDDQVRPDLMIKGSDLIVIAHHLTVPVEKKNPWPFVVAHVKTTRDGYPVRDPYGKVEGISRAWGEILTGVKDKLPQKRLIKGSIINHKFKFSTVW
jgi:hypothetical protein